MASAAVALLFRVGGAGLVDLGGRCFTGCLQGKKARVRALSQIQNIFGRVPNLKNSRAKIKIFWVADLILRTEVLQNLYFSGTEILG